MRNDTFNALILRHGDPARRWLDRRVLREVVSEARATPAQTE